MLAIILLSSQGISPQTKTHELPVIDISKKYPSKKVILQDIAEMEHIRLETTDDVLMSGVAPDGDVSILAAITDRYIVTYELRRGEIFIFNRKGEIVSHFNHKGPSDQEYFNITSGVIFDEKNEEIFVCNNRNIQVYSLNGKYKRTLKFANLKYEIYNFDDETLLVYDEVDILSSNAPKKNPYRLISKEDGNTVVVFDISLPKRYSMEILYDKWILTTSLSNNRYYGKDFVITDISSDTMYLNNNIKKDENCFTY